ncbi:PilW family protein [Thermodesulfobacteriota bacterium]
MKTSNTAKSCRRNQGFTLLGMLVALALSGFVVAGMYNISTSQVKSFHLQDQLSETQQFVRGTLDEMSFNLRLAGYIPYDDRDGLDDDDIDTDVDLMYFSDGENEDFEAATANRIVIQADVNNDGDTDTVEYALIGTYIYRRKWQWDNDTTAWIVDHSYYCLAERVDSLTFEYIFDDGDSGIPNDADLDPSNDRDDIVAIDITLSVYTEQEYDDIRTGYNKSGTVEDGTCPIRTLNSHVTIRNRQT